MLHVILAKDRSSRIFFIRFKQVNFILFYFIFSYIYIYRYIICAYINISFLYVRYIFKLPAKLFAGTI